VLAISALERLSKNVDPSTFINLDSGDLLGFNVVPIQAVLLVVSFTEDSSVTNSARTLFEQYHVAFQRLSCVAHRTELDGMRPVIELPHIANCLSTIDLCLVAVHVAITPIFGVAEIKSSV
jgi:hypothetical protein